MKAPMKLRSTIKKREDGRLVATAKQYDGSEFRILVRINDVVINESFSKEKTEVPGFIFVSQIALQHDRAYISLPEPSITHGSFVTVKKTDLQPINASIKDFNPQKKSGIS
jgi:hypothetical protein